MRTLYPASGYFLATRSLKPISRKFGFDRGTPIDRYWIESFLSDHHSDIKGRVLEIGDNRYTKQFGGNAVKQSDVLDVVKNPQATIIADLANVSQVADETFDCIVLTHVLGIVPEYQQALKECYRLLKKNGTLLITVSCFSPVQTHSPSLWRFSPRGLAYAVGKAFGEENVQVSSYGNVLSGQMFWVGMSQEEMTKEEIEYRDPEYPCIATCRAVKQ